jgi:hypothetical protein
MLRRRPHFPGSIVKVLRGVKNAQILVVLEGLRGLRPRLSSSGGILRAQVPPLPIPLIPRGMVRDHVS